MCERPLMWDNVQSAGHHCKINPDRVTPTQSIHNLHLIPSWHLNWKSVFVHLGELSGFDRDESSWPCSVHSGLPPSLLFGRFTCRTRLVIAWVLAYISFFLFHLEVMRTMSVNLTCGLNTRLCSGCPTQCIQHCHILHIRPRCQCRSLCVHRCLVMARGKAQCECVHIFACLCVFSSGCSISCFGLCRALL